MSEKRLIENNYMNRNLGVLIGGFIGVIFLSLFAAIGLPARLRCVLSLVCEHGIGYYIGQVMYAIVWPVEVLLQMIGSDSLRIPIYLIWFFVIGIIAGFLIKRFR